MELEELRRIAAKKELSLNYVAKDEIISKILLDLQGFDDIILKGGTAVNRVYLKNKRFSEDIDFDLIFKGNVKSALSRTKEIILKVEGFNIEKPRIMNETIRYDIFYFNPLSHKDKIRLEFKVITKGFNYNKKIVNFGFVPYRTALLNVYKIEELIKHKVQCILNRVEGKDFFDLYYLLELEHGKINFNKKKIINRINLEEKQVKIIENTLNHYIPRNERPNWHSFLEKLKEKIQKNF